MPPRSRPGQPVTEFTPRTPSRLRIDGHVLLEEISKLTAQLVSGWIPSYPQPDVEALRFNGADPDQYRPVEFLPMGKDDRDRVTAALQVYLKLLNKVMPDLKAIELNALVEQTNTLLDDRELAQRARFLDALRKRDEERGVLSIPALPPEPPTRQ